MTLHLHGQPQLLPNLDPNTLPVYLTSSFTQKCNTYEEHLFSSHFKLAPLWGLLVLGIGNSILSAAQKQLSRHVGGILYFSFFTRLFQHTRKSHHFHSYHPNLTHHDFSFLTWIIGNSLLFAIRCSYCFHHFPSWNLFIQQPDCSLLSRNWMTSLLCSKLSIGFSFPLLWPINPRWSQLFTTSNFISYSLHHLPSTLMVLRHAQHAPTVEPLHLLFSSSEVLLPRYHCGSMPHFLQDLI